MRKYIDNLMQSLKNGGYIFNSMRGGNNNVVIAMKKVKKIALIKIDEDKKIVTMTINGVIKDIKTF